MHHTERETTLRAYEHLMIDHLPIGLALFDAHDLRLLAANRLYQSHLAPQWQQEMAVGHTLSEVIVDAESAGYVEVFRKVAQTGISYKAKDYAAFTCPDATTYWKWRLDPVVEQDEVRYLLLTATDVTAEVVARKLAEQEQIALAQTHQQEEQERLHTVLDQLPEGIVIVDGQTGKIKYANTTAARLLGYALPHLLGAPLNQSALLFPHGRSKQYPQSVFRWNFALIHALWGKTTDNQEIVVPRPDGSEIVILSSAAPIRSTPGRITEAVMVFQDITDIKRLEQQKNEFFEVANHELRTPLTAILGFTELLQVSVPEGAEEMYRYAVASIAKEGEHLTRLIRDLLDISRLEERRLEVRRRYQNVLALLMQIVSKRAQSATSHWIYLVLDGLHETDQIIGHFDLLRIEQIMNNLLDNAIKYSPARSEIEVGVGINHTGPGGAEQVLIRVKDQGIGIAEQDVPHIFERFYRSYTLDESISGFGIGLYLTKELVLAHGGRIWVESVPGQGSTFFVALPLGALR